MDKLYHYTSYSTLLKILRTKSLRFGELQNTNDPKEYSVPHLVYLNIEMNTSHIYAGKIKKEIDKYNVICFTTDSDIKGYAHARMWDQYAQRGEGCCICLNKEKLEKNIEELKVIKSLNIEGNPIDYKDGMEILDYNSKYRIEDFVRENIGYFIFSKTKDWETEKEYRYSVYNNTEYVISLPIANAIEGFYFGPDFPEILKQTVMDQFLLPKEYNNIIWHNGVCKINRSSNSLNHYRINKIEEIFKGKLIILNDKAISGIPNDDPKTALPALLKNGYILEDEKKMLDELYNEISALKKENVGEILKELMEKCEIVFCAIEERRCL